MLSGEAALASASANTSAPSEPLNTLWLRDLLATYSGNTPSGTVPKSHLHLLGGGVQKARVRTFGWDSTLAAGGDKSLRRDCIGPVALELLQCLNIHDGRNEPKSAEEEAKVPLVFIVMDVGGAIVKQVRIYKTVYSSLCSMWNFPRLIMAPSIYLRPYPSPPPQEATT